MVLKDITRQAVLAAIAEYDRVGSTATGFATCLRTLNSASGRSRSSAWTPRSSATSDGYASSSPSWLTVVCQPRSSDAFGASSYAW
jgi:hypothetical protein